MNALDLALSEVDDSVDGVKATLADLKGFFEAAGLTHLAATMQKTLAILESFEYLHSTADYIKAQLEE